MKKLIASFAASAALLAVAPAAVAVEQQFISIGTGGVTGVYFPVGGAICRLVNKDRKTHGLRCSTESTGGSVDNINGIRGGELQFGVVQSDQQYDAYHRTAGYADLGSFDTLRAVFSLHPEPFTVLVRKGSGITKFEDLKGKKVNVGNSGSGPRATMEVIMDAYGLQMSDLVTAAEVEPAKMAQAICDGTIDVMIYAVGHPSAAVTEATATCTLDLVPVTGAPIDALVAQNPFYRKATIPGGMYRGNDKDVDTFGVAATLVSSADVPDDVVYIVVKSVFDYIDDFRKLHPAFAHLMEQEMITQSLSAPLHAGAERYYRERGWIESAATPPAPQ